MRILNIEIDHKRIAEIAATFMVQELALFGSVLGSDFKADSDIDILVLFKKGAALSYFDLCDLQEELEKLFNRKIDLVEKESLINPYRRTEILKSARRIYAA